MRELYETEYGIYDHLNSKNRPLAGVAFFPDSEDVNTDSLLEESVRRYIDKGIKDIYGLSLIEFMDLPLDVVEMLCRLANSEKAKKANMISQIEKELQ